MEKEQRTEQWATGKYKNKSRPPIRMNRNLRGRSVIEKRAQHKTNRQDMGSLIIDTIKEINNCESNN
jgi:hypothetical protein